MKKEEILSQAIAECVEVADQPQTRTGYERSFREILSSALDAYAFSVVEASVPSEEPVPDLDTYDVDDARRNGFNSCRSQTLLKGKTLTNQ